MPFELFNYPRTHMGSAIVRLNKYGSLSLNRAAMREFFPPPITDLNLYYDTERCLIGLKSAPKSVGTFQLRFLPHGRRIVHIGSFVKHYMIDTAGGRRFRLVGNTVTGIIELHPEMVTCGE